MKLCGRQFVIRVLSALGVARLLFFLAAGCVMLVSAQDASPAADQAMERVREAYPSFDFELSGTMYGDSEEGETPFVMRRSSNTAIWRIGRPPRVVQLQIRPDGRQREGTTTSSEEMIPGTSLRAEDLTFDFLFWQQSTTLRQDREGSSMSAWVIRFIAPSEDTGATQIVDVWVHQLTGQITKADFYDRSGFKTKTISVRSLQEFAQGYLPRNIVIESFAGAAGERTSRTYLRFNAAEASGLVQPSSTDVRVSLAAAVPRDETKRSTIVGGAKRYESPGGGSQKAPSTDVHDGSDLEKSRHDQVTEVAAVSRKMASETRAFQVSETMLDSSVPSNLGERMLSDQRDLLLVVAVVFVLLLVTGAYLAGRSAASR